MKKYIAALALLIAACNTYDLPIIYKKNFQPGNHSLLRLDGYYIDSLGPKPNGALNDVYGKPIFFYGDGSALAAEMNMSNASVPSAVQNNLFKGSWGNYKIIADTILFERFHLVSSNYRRIILKGVISKDQIHWISRKDHTEDYKPVDYSVYFKNAKQKPDSTQNWTRKREKYNR